MRGFLRKMKYRLLPLLPLAQAFLIVLVSIFLLLITVMIILNGDVLGIWLVPILLAYFACIAAVIGWKVNEEEMRKLHIMLGDADFYRMYPRRKIRDEKKAERLERNLQRIQNRRNLNERKHENEER